MARVKRFGNFCLIFFLSLPLIFIIIVDSGLFLCNLYYRRSNNNLFIFNQRFIWDSLSERFSRCHGKLSIYKDCMTQINEQGQVNSSARDKQTSEDHLLSAFTPEVENAPIDPRITYPCYKSFDEFIDVERLKSLDDYITERIKQHVAAKPEEYFLNAYRLDNNSPYQPGAREIWLSRPKFVQSFEYNDLDKTELWERTEEAETFSLLMDFIETLPFKATGRMLIIYDDTARSVPAHRDHLNTEICYEFVWFRTNLRKPFYMLNHKTEEKKYVESYSAWFDSVNQFHGVDAQEGFSFSIRVDGVFADEFKKQIPIPEFNPASTPSLWACAGNES